ARVVRRLLVEPDVVVGAVRGLSDVPNRVIESLRVRAPGGFPRLGSEGGRQILIRAAGQRVHHDVAAALVCDAGAVRRPGGAVVGDAGGIGDVLGNRARSGEIEDVDVEARRTARALGEGDLRAIGRPGGVPVLIWKPRRERTGGGPGTCAARDG